MRIECHLIVAAACRMKTAARLPNRICKALFNIHVDVFKFDTERKISTLNLREDVAQPLLNRRTILLGENANPCQHGSMCKRACNILAVHPTIELNGGLELVDHLIGCFGETTAPELLAHYFCPSCMSARTLSGRPKRLMKPPASA